MLQYVVENFGGDTGIESHNPYGLWANAGDIERFVTGRTDDTFFQTDFNAGFGQHREVGGGESIEAIGVGLGRAVSPEQFIVEIQANFSDGIVRGQIKRIKQVGLPVRTQLAERDL